MIKKRIMIVIAMALVLGLGVMAYQHIVPGEYVPADDEIALHILLNTEEDIGLLIFDYRADDYQSSGGIANANKTMMKRNSDIIEVWNRHELNSDSDAVEMTIRIRVVTEYVNPNFENIYPDDITKYIDAITWEARFGESYFFTITGDKTSGYKAVLNR